MLGEGKKGSEVSLNGPLWSHLKVRALQRVSEMFTISRSPTYISREIKVENSEYRVS